MNYAIILCLCALIIIMLAMTFSRSQSLQRFGVIEFSLVLAVGGSALFGYMQAQQLTTDQYFQLFSVHFGGAYAYINELEQCDEYDDSAKKQKLGELEKLLNDILPVTYTEDESYRYVNAVVLERDETDNYRQCWFSGENTHNTEKFRSAGLPAVHGRLSHGRPRLGHRPGAGAGERRSRGPGPGHQLL